MTSMLQELNSQSTAEEIRFAGRYNRREWNYFNKVTLKIAREFLAANEKTVTKWADIGSQQRRAFWTDQQILDLERNERNS